MTAYSKCETCSSYHKPDSPLCAEFAELHKFQAWLRPQGMETSTDGKVRCAVHGKRTGSVTILENGRIEYLCYHCKLAEFRQLKQTQDAPC